MAGYKGLKVWEEARQLVATIYQLSASLPPSEQYGLVSQLRRAAVSIPANIAEGYGRNTSQAYIHFLRIAKGSANELETLLILCEDLGFLSDLQDIFARVALVGSMLNGLIEKVGPSIAREQTSDYGDTVTMFRPTGPNELRLVEDSGYKAWPPRLAEQPIFYPVTNEQYASEIAERWNVRDSGVGYVTRFSVRRQFADRYPIQCVGASHHTEWWIPAEDLQDLNQNIVGNIEVIREFVPSEPPTFLTS